MSNHRPRPNRRQSVLRSLLPACCLVALVSGCQTGPDGNWTLSVKNPVKGVQTLAKKSKDSLSSLVADKTPEEPANKFAQEMARARNLERAGKYEEARPIYEGLIADYPDRYEPRHRLGVVADRQRRYREAQALYSEAIRLEPNNPDVFNDLGYCLFLQGQLDKSESALLKSVSLSPADSRYRNNLGMVYGHQGRYEEALDQFRSAGSEADAYYNLAFVLAAKEEVEGAKNCFRLALAADPTYDRARAALKSFERFEKDPEGLTDNSPAMENGVPWVPYVEGSESQTDDVRTASHTSPSASSRSGPFRRFNSQGELRGAPTQASQDVQHPGE